jgi:hypothetical protein
LFWQRKPWFSLVEIYSRDHNLISYWLLKSRVKREWFKAQLRGVPKVRKTGVQT